MSQDKSNEQFARERGMTWTCDKCGKAVPFPVKKSEHQCSKGSACTEFTFISPDDISKSLKGKSEGSNKCPWNKTHPDDCPRCCFGQHIVVGREFLNIVGNWECTYPCVDGVNLGTIKDAAGHGKHTVSPSSAEKEEDCRDTECGQPSRDIPENESSDQGIIEKGVAPDLSEETAPSGTIAETSDSCADSRTTPSIPKAVKPEWKNGHCPLERRGAFPCRRCCCSHAKVTGKWFSQKITWLCNYPQIVTPNWVTVEQIGTMANYWDWYATLGIEPVANPEQIEEAYSNKLDSLRAGRVEGTPESSGTYDEESIQVETAHWVLSSVKWKGVYDARRFGGTHSEPTATPPKPPKPPCGDKRYWNRCLGCKNKGPHYSNGWQCKKDGRIIHL